MAVGILSQWHQLGFWVRCPAWQNFWYVKENFDFVSLFVFSSAQIGNFFPRNKSVLFNSRINFLFSSFASKGYSLTTVHKHTHAHKSELYFCLSRKVFFSFYSFRFFFLAALDFVFSAPGASAFTGAVVFLFFLFELVHIKNILQCVRTHLDA